MLKLIGSLLIFLHTALAHGLSIDDLQSGFDLDLLFHYSRIERTTTTNNINFLSRTGGMLAVQFNQPLNLFTSFYVGGDVAYSLFEAPGSNQLDPTYYVPWQGFLGFAAQTGDSRDFEISGGVGFSTEYYQELIAFESYELKEKYTIRAHVGLSYRFLSMLGTNARIRVRYFYPLTKVDHGNNPLKYLGILDSTLRLKFTYRATWSLFGGIRFEDYQVADKSVTYFNTRIYAGFGFHF